MSEKHRKQGKRKRRLTRAERGARDRQRKQEQQAAEVETLGRAAAPTPGQVTDTTGSGSVNPANLVTETTLSNHGASASSQPPTPIRFRGEGQPVPASGQHLDVETMFTDSSTHNRRDAKNFKEYLSLGLFTEQQVEVLLQRMWLLGAKGRPREAISAFRELKDTAKCQVALDHKKQPSSRSQKLSAANSEALDTPPQPQAAAAASVNLTLNNNSIVDESIDRLVARGIIPDRG